MHFKATIWIVIYCLVCDSAIPMMHFIQNEAKSLDNIDWHAYMTYLWYIATKKFVVCRTKTRDFSCWFFFLRERWKPFNSMLHGSGNNCNFSFWSQGPSAAMNWMHTIFAISPVLHISLCWLLHAIDCLINNMILYPVTGRRRDWH